LGQRAVFIDRDGVINVQMDGRCVTSVEDFTLIPQIVKILKRLQEAGFLLIVITNQSAINRGLLSHEGLDQIHQYMKEQLSSHGIRIDRVYYCPHAPEEGCECRKPGNRLILDAIDENKIDRSGSWLIGDKDSDVEAATRSGIGAVKTETNSPRESILSDIIGLSQEG